MPTIEVYQRADGRWAWRLTASNGRIIATDGGQGYENRADCEQIARDVVGGHYAPHDHHPVQHRDGKPRPPRGGAGGSGASHR